MLNNLLADMRYAMRSLRKEPLFAVVALLTFAIGIGSNTAIFSVVEATLLRSLPYSDVGRLVYVSEVRPQSTGIFGQASYPDYLDWQTTGAFEGTAGFTGRSVFVGDSSPELVGGGRVTPNFFDVLGVKPQLGRLFTAADTVGDGRLVIVTSEFWKRVLHSDAAAIGRSVIVNGSPHLIVGVLPGGFHFGPLGAADVWTPVIPSAAQRERRFMHWLWVIARVKANVSIETAEHQIGAVGARIVELDPESHRGSSVHIGPLSDIIVGSVRPIVLALFVAVGMVSLIACANIANLVLARTASRQQEFAIRVALGAGRRRLLRQLLTETVLLSLTGGVVGLLIAHGGLAVLLSQIPQTRLDTLPFLKAAGLNVQVLGFTFVLSVLTGTVCGVLPFVQMGKANLRAQMAPGRRARDILAVSEVAIALMLVIFAGLLIKSTVRLFEVDPGFDRSNLLTFHVTLPAGSNESDARLQEFYHTSFEQIGALPGVIGVTTVNLLPLSGEGTTGVPTIDGQANDPSERVEANLRTVASNYFSVMKIPLIGGRSFSNQDRTDTPLVVMVNRALALRLFRTADPIGKRISFRFTPGRTFEIVGVVSDENVNGLDVTANPVIYFPQQQDGSISTNFVVRTFGEPGTFVNSIRERIRSTEANAIVSSVRTMDDIIDTSPYTFLRQYPAMLLGTLALIALLLATIGIYGVIAYSVSQRTRELGVRMAVGASQGDIFKLVVLQGAALAAIGVIAGSGLAFLATRFLGQLLFGVTPTDPFIFTVAACIFIAVAALASYLPARRASRVDPLSALKTE